MLLYIGDFPALIRCLSDQFLQICHLFPIEMGQYKIPPARVIATKSFQGPEKDEKGNSWLSFPKGARIAMVRLEWIKKC